MRIHELAKELGMENKVLVDFLRKLGCDIKSHMSACPDNMISVVRDEFGNKDKPIIKIIKPIFFFSEFTLFSISNTSILNITNKKEISTNK